MAPAAHPHASRLTHSQDHNLNFNSVTSILTKLLLHFKYYWTAAQIENMRIVYNCFTPQFWNLGHVKIRPLFLGNEGIRDLFTKGAALGK